MSHIWDAMQKWVKCDPSVTVTASSEVSSLLEMTSMVKADTGNFFVVLADGGCAAV